jgi:uncharacterized repeat protein (TIGR01451 family)
MNSEAISNVVVTDTLPLDVDFVLASDGGVYDPGTHTVTWDIGTVLAAASERCLQLATTVLTSSATTITNRATIEAGTPPYDVTTTVTEQTDTCLPELSKDDGIAEGECAGIGEYLSYDLCFDNIEGTEDIYNVLVTDSLPLEVDFVLASDGGVYESGTHTVIWDIGTVPAGAPQRCLQLSVTVLSPPTLTVTNQVTIEGGVPPDDIKTTVTEQTDVCGIALVAPLNGRIDYLSPEMQWKSSFGPRALYVVDFLLPPSGSIISIPPRQDTKWKVPDSTWSKVPRGSKIYWRVRGLDPDATPPVVFTSEAWRFYKY